VWRARDRVEQRPVALKVALPSVVAEHGRAEIEKEARIAASLAHPNVVAVRNADWIDGCFVIATELAKRNLAEYAGARRSGAVALRVIRDVTAGLAYAHSRGLIHRDLKPENILVFADGHAALADFGVSRFARSPQATFTDAGTIGYMAPEQAYGRPTLSSDVFSLGLISYALLSGRLPTWPFDWPPPGLRRFEARTPAALRGALHRAMMFEPARRFEDAIALQTALARGFRRVESAKTPTRRRRRRPKPVRSPLEVQAEAFRREHGRRLEMRFACHRCEGPISEAMRVCPWCGFGDNAFTAVTTYPLVCPECERGVRAEWNACPWCYAGRLESNGRKPRHDPRAERHCSHNGCGAELRPFMQYCPMCKQKPKRPWIDRELGHRCPRCRWSVSEHWHFCPWCGRREAGAGRY